MGVVADGEADALRHLLEQRGEEVHVLRKDGWKKANRRECTARGCAGVRTLLERSDTRKRAS